MEYDRDNETTFFFGYGLHVCSSSSCTKMTVKDALVTEIFYFLPQNASLVLTGVMTVFIYHIVEGSTIYRAGGCLITDFFPFYALN